MKLINEVKSKEECRIKSRHFGSTVDVDEARTETKLVVENLT